MRVLFMMGVALLILAACTYTDTVFLRHPKTGLTAQCGPYRYSGYTATAAAMRESRCIDDYQRQGYERVPK